MDRLKRLIREFPWACAAAIYAWGIAVALLVAIVIGTAVLVVPPALVATAPLLVRPEHRARTSLIAAVALALWAILGITLLGTYFLPSAILLGLGYSQTRTRR